MTFVRHAMEFVDLDRESLEEIDFEISQLQNISNKLNAEFLYINKNMAATPVPAFKKNFFVQSKTNSINDDYEFN